MEGGEGSSEVADKQKKEEKFLRTVMWIFYIAGTLSVISFLVLMVAVVGINEVQKTFVSLLLYTALGIPLLIGIGVGNLAYDKAVKIRFPHPMAIGVIVSFIVVVAIYVSLIFGVAITGIVPKLTF
jgi:hypothetical protein